MPKTPEQLFTRRALVAAALAGAAAPVLAAPARRVVTVLGDSITAGLGLPAAQALPAQLESRLARLGAPARVRGAGVSGDTTAAGLARVDFSVQGDTDVCVARSHPLHRRRRKQRLQQRLDRCTQHRSALRRVRAGSLVAEQPVDDYRRRPL